MRYPDGGGLTAEQRRRREEVWMRSVDLFEEGVEVPRIARELRVSEKSVYQWRRTWRTGGREALRSRGPSGYGCRLGSHLQDKLATWLDEGPAAHGWVDDQVWTAARVRTLIGCKFHISYSVCGVTRLLSRRVPPAGFEPSHAAPEVASKRQRIPGQRRCSVSARLAFPQVVRISGLPNLRCGAAATRAPEQLKHQDACSELGPAAARAY
ncbi:helix-turn-helix domain-containing protein [Streptomyces sp. NBC_00117]|uniref:helix-turn-helix domain-containing protein n=1 Tax=Streptomyces sp. NBC_00117 TaxID=2975657 RepID=UPI003244A3BE